MFLPRRLRLRWFGECKWEGCHEPRVFAYLALLDYCWPHYHEDLDRWTKKRDQEKFDREANIIAEGIRRSRSEQSTKNTI